MHVRIDKTFYAIYQCSIQESATKVGEKLQIRLSTKFVFFKTSETDF